MRPILVCVNMTQKIARYVLILIGLGLLTACGSADRLRVDLPKDWKGAWVMYTFPLDEAQPKALVDTLQPDRHRLTWNKEGTENLEIVLIPVGAPRFDRQGSSYKLHLYLTPEERIRASVTGTPEAFTYEISEGSRLNREVCAFTNAFAPGLEAERLAMNRLFDLLQEKRETKIRIDSLLAPAKESHIANGKFAIDYYKDHARDVAASHYWLHIFSSEAIALATLMPNGVRNGLLKHRIDARLQPKEPVPTR